MTIDLDNKQPPAPITPPPPAAVVPLCPDLDKPPYAKPVGSVFWGEEWTPLMNRLDDKVSKIVCVCQSIALNLNVPVQHIWRTGFQYNILALDDLTIAEITRDCWLLVYEIISKGYAWQDLVSEGHIIARVKRNLRQSQPRLRWDVACDDMLSLGFTEQWLYE